jgi:hypothetical protein
MSVLYSRVFDIGTSREFRKPPFELRPAAALILGNDLGNDRLSKTSLLPVK